MDVLRTPEARFENLAGYPFAPHHAEVVAGEGPALRMHYVDEGPDDGRTVVLLHGEPTWSYLYRTMIPPLVRAGYRVLAPDLIGFGRSDKPTRVEDYSYLRHVEWVTSWFARLELRDVLLFGQDWGALIGLRVAAEQGHRIAKLAIANGSLPTAEHRVSIGIHAWQAFARRSPLLPAGRLVGIGTFRRVRPAARRGYDAPFPDRSYQAGSRAFPQLLPTNSDDPAVPANRAAWTALGHWHKPFLAVFGRFDPIFGRADRDLIDHIPGASRQPHGRINGGHFVQEDSGPELAARIIDWDLSPS